ncbi:hypothetical protein KEM48_007608 [Puccinia striiformis f. sp. tritici PST-130]|nr:hypothetical protein KEM48_007608 [Puccinia striiformis f. sp. tritici PST-130]
MCVCHCRSNPIREKKPDFNEVKLIYTLIPHTEDTLQFIVDTAVTYILVIESEALMRQIIGMSPELEDSLGKMILLCTKGSPDYNLQGLINILSNLKHHDVVERNVPIPLLFDCDPAGFQHIGTIKYNSPDGIKRKIEGHKPTAFLAFIK